MNLRGLIVASVSLVGGATWAFAEDAGKAAPAQTEDNSIATAKKSFDALKSKRPGEERSGPLDLSLQLTAPEFTPGALSVSDSNKPKALTPKPSKNWLVDGVMAKPSPGQMRDAALNSKKTEISDGSETTDLEKTDLLAESVNPALARKDVADTPTREKLSNAPVTEAANPLASFMSGWISQQDRALLLKPTTPEGSVASDLANLSGLNASSTVSATPAAGSLAASVGGIAPALRENPYLSITAAPNLPAGLDSISTLNQQNFTPTAVNKSLDPVFQPQPNDSLVEPNGNKSSRDMMKPDADAKYFKQLKRF